MKKIKLFADCDRKIFLAVMLTLSGLLLAGYLIPEKFYALWNRLNFSIVSNFGWFYLGLLFVIIFYMIYLAFSKYGKLKLGPDDSKPEYSTFAWVSMLFSAGVGIGFVYWGAAEVLMHYMDIPYRVASASGNDALAMAVSISVTDWGLIGWAAFSLVGLGMGFATYRLGKPLTLSSAMYGLLGERAHGPLGKIVDYFSVIATIAGISTTLGFGVISVAYAVNSLFGIPDTMSLKFAIVVLMVVVFVSSSYIGIKKGMNRLSQFSIYAGLFTMVFLFIFGPTSFLLDSLVMSVGTYLDNFFYLHTWTDPIGQSGWLNTWTIFYCGWWIAWVPFTGGFIAKISKGRTIKEFILGVMILPSALTMVWFCTLGSSAVYAQITDKVDIYSSLMENSASGIYLLLSSYPFGSAMCIIVMITMMTFIITSTDASAFYCATIISKGVLEPSRQIKVICGIIIGLTAFFLLTTGGLQALQTMAIVGAFPFSIILLLLIFSVRNMLATAWQEREMAIESKKVA